MHAVVKKRVMVLAVGIIALLSVLYAAFPLLFHTETGPHPGIDYSARYYELLSKKALTEAALEELEQEKAKTDATIRQAIQEQRESRPSH